MARLTTTVVARSFSEVLDRATAGEEIEITRSRATVAVIGPPRARMLSAERYRKLMRSAPGCDEDFLNDLREIRGEGEDTIQHA